MTPQSHRRMAETMLAIGIATREKAQAMMEAGEDAAEVMAVYADAHAVILAAQVHATLAGTA